MLTKKVYDNGFWCKYVLSDCKNFIKPIAVEVTIYSFDRLFNSYFDYECIIVSGGFARIYMRDMADKKDYRTFWEVFRKALKEINKNPQYINAKNLDKNRVQKLINNYL